MECDPLWDKRSCQSLEQVASDIVSAVQPDQYWAELRDIYNSLPDTMPASDRWAHAYQQMSAKQGEFREPGSPPDFYDPYASAPQDFVAQYAIAIGHMLATHSSHLELPKHFMERWRKAQSLFGKEG